eukprot:6206992-Pleurochrysis_carterae.AAC.3
MLAPSRPPLHAPPPPPPRCLCFPHAGAARASLPRATRQRSLVRRAPLRARLSLRPQIGAARARLRAFAPRRGGASSTRPVWRWARSALALAAWADDPPGAATRGSVESACACACAHALAHGRTCVRAYVHASARARVRVRARVRGRVRVCGLAHWWVGTVQGTRTSQRRTT